MRLLLDTNIVIPLVEEQPAPWPSDVSEALDSVDNSLHGSVASLWEIAIKSRLGKLPLRNPLPLLPDALFLAGIDIIAVRVPHVITELDPLPDTRDRSTGCCLRSAGWRTCGLSRATGSLPRIRSRGGRTDR